MAITNLSEYLKNIADAIRAKKGTTDSINAQNFASEITSISGGSGDGATIAGGVIGTPIPLDSTTVIHNIYFNLNTSVAEVQNLLETLLVGRSLPIAYLLYFYDENTGNALMLAAMNMEGNCMIQYNAPNLENEIDGVLFATGPVSAEIGFEGWNPSFNGILEVNGTNAMLIESLPSEYYSVDFNEAIAGVISSALFTNNEPTVLSGEYTPVALSITENGEIDLMPDIANKKIVTNIKANIVVEPDKAEILNWLIGYTYSTKNLFSQAEVNENDNVSASILDIVPKLDLTKVRDCTEMFKNNTDLQGHIALYNIGKDNTRDGTDMYHTITKIVPALTNMFEGCKNITSVDLSLNTEGEYSEGFVYGLFSGCTALETVKLSNIDGTPLTIGQVDKPDNLSDMFACCWNLKEVPELNLIGPYFCCDYMFSNCSSLKKVVLPINDENSSGIYTASSMFSSCSNLELIDLGCCLIPWEEDYHSLSSFMFAFCSSLKTVIIRRVPGNRIWELNDNAFSGCYHFTGQVNSNYNPDGLKDGRIYMPDDLVAGFKAAAGWSTYADCIYPLSEYVAA